MRIGLLALVALVALVTAGAVLGQGAIEKCIGADGKITYSDSGCSHGAKVGGYVERERSKADAAAARRAANQRARQQEFARRRAKTADEAGQAQSPCVGAQCRKE
jgi:hypothetical protein